MTTPFVFLQMRSIGATTHPTGGRWLYLKSVLPKAMETLLWYKATCFMDFPSAVLHFALPKVHFLSALCAYGCRKHQMVLDSTAPPRIRIYAPSKFLDSIIWYASHYVASGVLLSVPASQRSPSSTPQEAQGAAMGNKSGNNASTQTGPRRHSAAKAETGKIFRLRRAHKSHNVCESPCPKSLGNVSQLGDYRILNTESVPDSLQIRNINGFSKIR